MAPLGKIERVKNPEPKYREGSQISGRIRFTALPHIIPAAADTLLAQEVRFAD